MMCHTIIMIIPPTFRNGNLLGLLDDSLRELAVLVLSYIFATKTHRLISYIVIDETTSMATMEDLRHGSMGAGGCETIPQVPCFDNIFLSSKVTNYFLMMHVASGCDT